MKFDHSLKKSSIIKETTVNSPHCSNLLFLHMTYKVEYLATQSVSIHMHLKYQVAICNSYIDIAKCFSIFDLVG